MRFSKTILGSQRRVWIFFKHSCLSKIHETVKWLIFGCTTVHESLFLRWRFSISFQNPFLTSSKWFSKWCSNIFDQSKSLLKNHPHLYFYLVEIRYHCSKPILGSKLRFKISTIFSTNQKLTSVLVLSSSKAVPSHFSGCNLLILSTFWIFSTLFSSLSSSFDFENVSVR